MTAHAGRKAGRVLYDDEGKLWSIIDRGLCFAAPLADDVTEQRTWFEIEVLQDRVRALTLVPEIPQDPTGTSFPWPLIWRPAGVGLSLCA